MGPGALAQVLRPLSQLSHPNLLVGLQTSDDAAVYRLSDDTAIIQTVDFFPPVVDDPYTYGAIAAANAMSDVYAMGGEVLLGLNIAAWPDDLPRELLGRIFAGGADTLAQVGAVVAGGHTVTDITGVGLLGHAAEMAEKSDVRIRIALQAVPLMSGVVEYAELGFVPGGTGRNRLHFSQDGPHAVRLPGEVPQALDDVLYD